LLLPVFVPFVDVPLVVLLGAMCVTRRQSASITCRPAVSVAGVTSQVTSTRSPARIWLSCCPVAEDGTESVRGEDALDDDEGTAVISRTVIVFARGSTDTISTEIGRPCAARADCDPCDAELLCDEEPL
jgi:hypothetical protein